MNDVDLAQGFGGLEEPAPLASGSTRNRRVLAACWLLKRRDAASTIKARPALTPPMLEFLIRESPLHPAAGTGAATPPFELQDD